MSQKVQEWRYLGHVASMTKEKNLFYNSASLLKSGRGKKNQIKKHIPQCNNTCRSSSNHCLTPAFREAWSGHKTTHRYIGCSNSSTPDPRSIASLLNSDSEIVCRTQKSSVEIVSRNRMSDSEIALWTGKLSVGLGIRMSDSEIVYVGIGIHW